MDLFFLVICHSLLNQTRLTRCLVYSIMLFWISMLRPLLAKITFSCEYKNGFATIYCINHTLALYKDYVKYISSHTSVNEKILPCVLPNYDHTPRSGKKRDVIAQINTSVMGKALENVFILRSHIKEEENLVFIKAWNEWGKGIFWT